MFLICNFTGKQANLATLITLLESLGCYEAVDILKSKQGWLILLLIWFIQM